MNNIGEKLKNSVIFKILPLLVFVFNPKIDLIYIPGYWQGIRLDDLIVLFYLIFFFFFHKGKIYPNLIHPGKQGFNFIIFFPYLVLSLLIGKFFGPPSLNIEWIIPLRYLEYIGLIVVLNELDTSKKTIIVLIKAYIVINFICVLLQYFHIIGAIQSRGFSPNMLTDAVLSAKPSAEKYDGFLKDVLIPPGGIYLNRAPGISGGPLELSTNLSISIFCLYIFNKSIIKTLPYFILTLIMLWIAQSRGLVFGFAAGLIFLIKDPKKILLFIIFIVSTSSVMYFFDLFEFKKIFEDKFYIDYIGVAKLFTASISGNIPPLNTFEGTGLESMWYRATNWNSQFIKLRDFWLFPFFGYGGDQVYTESLIVRMITCFGAIGTIIIIYFARNLPLYFLVFCFVSGLTFDLFVSFKIFLFSYLLLSIHKNTLDKYINLNLQKSN